MTETPPAVLGEVDRLDVARLEGARVCGAHSPMLPVQAAPFVCTRARGHRAAEHVASGDTPAGDVVAIAAWTGPEVDRMRVVGIHEGRWPS